jgi:hypothetical protein
MFYRFCHSELEDSALNFYETHRINLAVAYNTDTILPKLP